MPNHVHNLLKFDCSQKRLAEIYRALSYNGEGESDGVDFEKIIPMPATLNIESGSSTDRAVELYMTSINPAAPHYGSDKMEAPAFEFLHKAVNAQMHGRCNANLSATEIERHTQHGSEQDMLKLGEQAVTNLLRYKALTWYEWSINNWGTKWNSYDNSFDGETIAFNTAWAAPHPILQKLSEMYPDIQIEHQWADEDMGHNCGRKVYLGGKIEEEYYPESRKDALDLACEIWGSDIEDYGLVLNADESDYIDPNEDRFDFITLKGQPALFANDRLTDADVPKGLHCYHVRMDDAGKEYATIEPKVFVNLGGSIITSTPLEFGDEGHIPLVDGDFDFQGYDLTLDQFLDGQYDLNEGQTMN